VLEETLRGAEFAVVTSAALELVVIVIDEGEIWPWHGREDAIGFRSDESAITAVLGEILRKSESGGGVIHGSV
jgi:hypothetical protein